MKKTYINPTTEVVNVKTANHLLAGSPDGFNGTMNTNGVSGDRALGRGRSWDDEDYD